MKEIIPDLTNLDALQDLHLWREVHERNSKHFPTKRIPRFDYKNLPDTKHLRFELMTWDNFKLVLNLFENDPNPFITNQFKSLNDLEMYAVDQLEYAKYSYKRGACDWFIREKKTNVLIGILHIYELNWELIAGKHFPCMIGYGIAENHRNKGYAYEAAKHLLEQIPLIFKRFEARAEPEIANTASHNLLKKLGFIEELQYRDEKSTLFYKKLVDTIPIKTSEQVLQEKVHFQ